MRIDWIVAVPSSAGILRCCFATLMVALAATATVLGGDTPRAPNIVLVMADDLGWSDLGCYGGEIPTPHIDGLADRGVRFTQFYNNAVCGPTRASLLTGLYPQQVGHSGRHWNQPKDFQKCATISELLQAGGYQTAMVGKWQGRDLPARRGFDRFFGPMCQGKISYFHEVRQNPYYLDESRQTLPEDFYLTDALSDYAVEFLTQAASRDQPFFLYAAYIAPHWPLHAREERIARFRERYRAQAWNELRQRRFDRQRELGLIPKAWKLGPFPAEVHDWKDDLQQDWQAERMAVYAAQVAGIDAGVGRMLEVLRKTDKLRDTVFIFLSDNGAAPDGGTRPTNSGFGFGPQSGNQNWRQDGTAIRPGSGPQLPPGGPDTFQAYGLAWATLSNTPWKRTKSTAYEGGIRTPLVIQWPAGLTHDPGSIVPDMGHVMDLLPTFLELGGIEYPRELGERRPLPLEGRSLVPILHGRQQPPPDELCWSVPRNDAIRAGHWKLVNAAHGKAWELYDLDADGTETTNLAAKHPDVVQNLTARWEAWVERCDVPR